jgi:hypothetical protein
MTNALGVVLGGLTRRRGDAENRTVLGEEPPQLRQSPQITPADVSAESARTAAAVLRGSAPPRASVEQEPEQQAEH